MLLTNENYFSSEAQTSFMSASQFKAFSRCEAAALAEIRGEYARPKTTALLVGSYVDSYFEGSLDCFREENPALFRRDGGLKAEFSQAEAIISRLERDELFSLLMSGRKQVIRTGEIAGVPFKIKIDSLLGPEVCEVIAARFPETAAALGFLDGAIVDLKIMRDMEPVWSDAEHRYVNFVQAWGYDLQGAIYQAVEGHMLPFVLAAGTKEPETNIDALYIPDGDLAAKLSEVEELAPHFQAVKEGHEEPTSCGHCPYCRAGKRLTGIINYKEALGC